MERKCSDVNQAPSAGPLPRIERDLNVGQHRTQMSHQSS